MNKKNLSEIPEYWEMDETEIIDYLLDDNCDTLVNDITPVPHVEYSLSDLSIVWGYMQNHFKKVYR